MITAEETLLRKTTGCKPKGKEARQAFLGRLLETVEKLDDSEWEKMGQEAGGTAAQQWCNDAVDARKAEKEIPDFAAPDEAEDESEPEGDEAEAEDGDESEGEEESEDEGAEDEEEKVAKKAKTVKKAAAEKAPAKKAAGKKAAPAKKKAADDANGAKKSKGRANGPLEGIKATIKDLVIDQPHISLEDLLTKLQKGGNKMSRMTVSSVRSETRHTLRVLKAKGRLKGVEI